MAPRLGHRCCTGGAQHGRGLSLSIISVGIGCGGWRWHRAVPHQGETDPMDRSYKKRENRKKGKRGDGALDNP